MDFQPAPPCAKCGQANATVHINFIVGDTQETVHLCTTCSSTAGFDQLDAQALQEKSILVKSCGFCGQSAISGVIGIEAVYWCEACGLEYHQILTDICDTERPDLKQKLVENFAAWSMKMDPDMKAWIEDAHQRAIQVMKDRHS